MVPWEEAPPFFHRTLEALRKRCTLPPSLVCLIPTPCLLPALPVPSPPPQADINREADEFEAELRAAREETAAREAEQGQWEDDMADARSEGQFFKSLYPKPSKGKKGGGSGGGGGGASGGGRGDPLDREVLEVGWAGGLGLDPLMPSCSRGSFAAHSRS